MAHFTRQLTILTALVSLTMLMLVLVVARRSPPPNIVASGQPGFSTCRLPCWAGVMPDQTVFNQAAQIIADNLSGWNLNFRATNTQLSFSGSADQEQILGVIYEDRGLVGSIRLEVTFLLWQLIEELGTPYCVRTNHLTPADIDVVAIYWELKDQFILGIVMLDDPGEWKPDAPADVLFSLNADEQCSLPDALLWQGFAPLWRYEVNR